MPPRHDDSDTDEEDVNIDPELRLRTVRTAHSALEESIRTEQRVERRKTRRRRRTFWRKKETQHDQPAPTPASEAKVVKVPGERRKIYVNHSLGPSELDSNGEPIVRFQRNKVRTTKYTVLTFVPKNLYEQFRRVANIFFLTLVILQLFSVFGSESGAIAALPLAFILAVTALKDAVEDYRRAVLDEEVNTSASTKLGSWKNVNQPTDSRSWYEKLLGLNKPGRVTKGVRKLRERDAEAGMRIMLDKGGADASRVSVASTAYSAPGGPPMGAGGRRLEDIRDTSIESHNYPPTFSDTSSRTLLAEGSTQLQSNDWAGYQGKESMSQPSVYSGHPNRSHGVVDWNRQAGGSSRWERTLWKKLEVGDIVLLRDNDQVPADILVLSTSDPDGTCYVETKNLDGETNLKPRRSVKATSSITSEEDLERSSFILDSEPPHANLYLYNGVIRYKDPASGETLQEGVTINELILRGCSVRNTSWAIGLVVFTGADTKIMLNGGATPSKRSKIERETNFNVIVNFVLLMIMCIVGAVLNGWQDTLTDTSAIFFEAGADESSSPALNALITFVSCLIAFQNIVPISLYISIEIVKTIQAYFISQDVDMYYQPYDAPCVPKTWNISDDLGQIEYVFSDKTGTLTQNIMEFQKCTINGIAYGEGVTEAQRGAALREGGGPGEDPTALKERLDVLKQHMLGVMQKAFKNRYLQKDKLTLISPKLAEDMADKNGEQRQKIIAFFRALAVCHTVLSDKPDPTKPYHLDYKAESPDEAALVAAARDAGFPFVNKGKDSIDIEVLGQPERYIPLKVLEFNSTRKRMSVVVRAPDGRLILYCKGADSVIYERLDPNHDPMVKAQTSKDMEAFANSGLRTLCIAHRILDEEEYLAWSRTYDAATSSVDNRDEEIDKANELIETRLHILGATALEDKLQEGVPEAIETLHKAGIKLWILTGDKLQTAIEIGYSCNLLKQSMDIMIITADSMEAARSQIEAGLNKIASVLGPPSLKATERGFLPNAKASFAVVIDGDTLRHALTDELKPLFLNLGTQCETVVCCRVSPAQKALTVKLVKEGRNAMTLSIGDGANDVAMIQEANIGCGLLGLEGSQAAMSADYAFGQFRFLTKLLLVHGRWSYQRVADMHSNFFYKNVIWTFAMFWFLIFNSFDGTYLYQYTFILLYNLVFTSLPVIIMGAFDQDINARAALAFPQLYVRGIRGLEYTRFKFWTYMLDGLYQSAVVFFIPYLVWTLGPTVSWNGKTIESLSDFGTTVAVAAIFAANCFVGLNTNYWTIITWIVVFGSTIVMLLWIVIYSFFFSSDFIDEVQILFGELTFWTTVLFSATVALAPRFIIKFTSSAYGPLDKEIVREMWVMGGLKDDLGIKHRKESKNQPTGLEDVSSRELEAAPIFQQSHLRSTSETSLSSPQPFDRGYHSGTPSPLPSDMPAIREDPYDRDQGYFINDGNTQYSSHHQPQPRYDGLTPGYSLSPPQSVSPDGAGRSSYYSVSDLPSPSPLPSPLYKYPDGQVTTTPPRSRRGTFTSPPQSPPVSSFSGLSVPSTPQGGRSPIDSGTYEMRIRSPPRKHPLLGVQAQSQHQQDASDATFFSAHDKFQSSESEPAASGHYGPSASASSDLQPEDAYAGIEVDHDRRASQLSWTGGRAL